MPCVVEEYKPDRATVEANRILLLLDELAGKGALCPKNYRECEHKHKAIDGYVSHKDINELTARLCAQLRDMTERKIAKHSLEMQMWWRDHQEWDRRREEQERKDAEKLKAKQVENEKRANALAKLTREELRLLGIMP